MKKSIYSLFVVFMMLCVMSCGTATQENDAQGASIEEPNNTPLGQASVVDDVSAANILQVAIGSPDHTTLVAAVQAAHIEHVLVNAGPLTVFAPNNAAFAKLPEGTVENLVKPENIATLTTILTRHAAPGSYNIEGLKKEARKGRKLYMATGDYLEVTTEGDDVFVGGAKVIASIQTSNGIVNVVEDVILPKSE
ncbi:MAG: fasciclin domain-containing protein [Cyclobacteriaceae bacterium]|nr:fasciclin domain-containing protein [Cyclobacteriaceae bacterium]